LTPSPLERHGISHTAAARRGSRPAALLGLAVAVAVVLQAVPSSGQSLAGSPRSLEIQADRARDHDLTYIATARQLNRFVNAGLLVPVRPNANLELSDVSHPYARPQVRLFVERLAFQHRAACGEPLVVTSLTRPLSDQPPNASPLSVHPTGMAVDIRRSTNRDCRAWLERVLLSLEERAVLEATREADPPHYHVAVFPQPYARYVARITRATARPSAAAAPVAYRVRAGDTLWAIAQSHATTVRDLIETNGLEGTRIVAGQVLRIPPRQ
jgi:nucleoid-associated protein YgaU